MDKMTKRKLILKNQFINRNLIPKGVMALDEETLRKKREELKKKLANNEKVTIGNDGEVKPEDKQKNAGNEIKIPPGKLATFLEFFVFFKSAANTVVEKLFSKETKSISKDDVEELIDTKFEELFRIQKLNSLELNYNSLNQELFALKNSIFSAILSSNSFSHKNNIIHQNFENDLSSEIYRLKLANNLSAQFAKHMFPFLDNSLALSDYTRAAYGNGIPIGISNGEISVLINSGDNILIQEGKLASFYWYEKDPDLFEGEKIAMNKFFPNFKLKKLSDGRLYWEGSIKPKIIGNNEWHLMLIYENNHPSNNAYGGSIKVYSISPDLEEMQTELGCSIPHLLRDSDKSVYLCTARKEDVNAASQENIGGKVTTAAQSLSWAVKWISVYEMWLSGEVTTNEFQGHTF